MKFIPNLTGAFGRTQLQLQKHGPTIGFYGGLAGLGVTTVLACRATLRVQPAVQIFKEDLQCVNEIYNLEDPAQTRREHVRDLTYVYGKFARRAVREFALPVAIGSFSVAALTGSHVVLNRRNVALTGAYASMKEAFDAYRSRVAEEIGADKEENLRYGGSNKAGAKKGEEVPKPTYSPYARFFDEYSSNWQKEPEYNKVFLMSNQTYANDLLQSRGHIFLNEIYDMLGLARSREGAVVGWVRGNGDNFVDFGLDRESSIRFLQGWERSVLLDFNVDGVIYDLI